MPYINNSGRYAPAGFLFDKIGRVRVVVRDRDGPNPLKPKSGESKIEYVFETAMAAGSQDFDVFEKSDIVQVRAFVHGILQSAAYVVRDNSSHAHRRRRTR